MSDSPEKEVAATCAEAAYKLYSCTKCDDKIKVYYGKPLDHDFGEWEVVTEPTDTEAGVKKHTCKGCGRIETAPITSKNNSAEGGQ